MKDDMVLDSGTLAPLCENMMSSAKMEAHLTALSSEED